jgi:hypothetical protein
MVQARCDTCGRSLVPDQAGGLICPSCGRAAAIPSEVIAATMHSTDDSTTRPVPEFAQDLAERPTAPPPPPLDPQTAPAMPYPGEYVPPALPRSGGVPAASAAPPAAPPSASASRRAGRGAIASAITLLVLLIVGASGAVMLANGKLAGLLGSGTTTSVSATATPTTASGFSPFASPDGVYRLNVPSTWTSTQVPQSTLTLEIFADPATQANVNVEVLHASTDPNVVSDQYINQFGPALAGTGGTSALNGAPTADTTPLAGALWARRTATVTVTKQGQTAVTWQVVAQAVQHGQNTVLIAYFASVAVFATENADHFTPMLNSLTLG